MQQSPQASVPTCLGQIGGIILHSLNKNLKKKEEEESSGTAMQITDEGNLILL